MVFFRLFQCRLHSIALNHDVLQTFNADMRLIVDFRQSRRGKYVIFWIGELQRNIQNGISFQM